MKRYFPRILNLHFRNRDQAEARSRYCLAMASDHWNSLLQLLLMTMRRQMLCASLGQSPHGVPGWQNNRLLLHHGQDLLGHVLLVHHHLVHVLGEPVIRHDQVTWGDTEHHSAEPLQENSHRQVSPVNDALNRAWSRCLSLKTHTKTYLEEVDVQDVLRVH